MKAIFFFLIFYRLIFHGNFKKSWRLLQQFELARSEYLKFPGMCLIIACHEDGSGNIYTYAMILQNLASVATSPSTKPTDNKKTRPPLAFYVPPSSQLLSLRALRRPDIHGGQGRRGNCQVGLKALSQPRAYFPKLKFRTSNISTPKHFKPMFWFFALSWISLYTLKPTGFPASPLTLPNNHFTVY